MDGDEEQQGQFSAAAEIERLNGKAAGADRLTIADLLALMAVLRDPDRGCPWDQKQSFSTIAPYTIEEAYEVADAIARGDIADLKDELGDLLLQVAYHACMAEETGAFGFGDVADGITRKMIRRHPHVFGDEKLRAEIDIRGLWDRIKSEEAREKQSDADAGPSEPPSSLDGVPQGLPALTRSVKLQKKAAKVGFDWSETGPIIAKIREELGELEDEIASGDRPRIEEEYGDLLFVLANLARRLEVDPETALRNANLKFQRRFRHIEARLSEAGKSAEEASLDEMDAFWNEAKQLEKSNS